MTQFDPATTIDLSRYPLDRSGSDDYRSLVSSKRNQLNDQQYCTMPGFLLDQRRREVAAAVEGQQANTYRADSERNVYLERSRSDSLPGDHPQNIFARGCNSAHRVTPIIGNRRRLMCVMVYETGPGVIGDPVVNETVYGIKA